MAMKFFRAISLTGILLCFHLVSSNLIDGVEKCEELHLIVNNLQNDGDRFIFVHGRIDAVPTENATLVIEFSSEKVSLTTLNVWGLAGIENNPTLLILEPKDYGSFGAVFVAATRIFVSGVEFNGRKCDTSFLNMPVPAPWSYNGIRGPSRWPLLGYPDCGANNLYQSPINVISSTAAASSTKYKFKHPESNFEYFLNHSTPSFACAMQGTCGGIAKDGLMYYLTQFHFHTHSEHAVDGEGTVVEAHFVHALETPVSGTKILVLGLFLGISTAPNLNVSTFWTPDAFARAGGRYRISVKDFLGSSSGPGSRMFEFQGSLATPPCTGGVQWLLLEKRGLIGTAQYETLRGVVERTAPMGNYRTFQSVNGRAIGLAKL